MEETKVYRWIAPSGVLVESEVPPDDPHWWEGVPPCALAWSYWQWVKKIVNGYRRPPSKEENASGV